jgi:hypothetical protein
MVPHSNAKVPDLNREELALIRNSFRPEKETKTGLATRRIGSSQPFNSLRSSFS